MPFSDDISPYYEDFGNGYIPYVAVIGMDNILKFSDNHDFFESAAAAVLEMNQVYINPLEEVSVNFGENQTIDLNDLFYHPLGHDVTVTLANNSDTESLLAVVENNVLSITAQNVIGYPTLSFHGEAVGLENDFDLKVKVSDPNPTSIAYMYDLGDSPEQEPFPYNTDSPYLNTLEDLDWTTFTVTETGLLYSLGIDCYWRSYEHFEAGQLWMKSPAGLEVMIYQPEEDGFTSLDLELSAFYAQSAVGDWKVWLTDSEGNGGHQIVGLEITFDIIEPMSGFEDENVSTISNLSNFPNPFNPNTTIVFSTELWEQDEQIVVEVFNTKGQLIKNLPVTLSGVQGFGQDGNTFQVTWTGVDNQNNPVASGIYYYKVKNSTQGNINKMILLK